MNSITKIFINYITKIIFCIIIFVQIVFFSYIFSNNKKSFHSDELWNYGFANSSSGVDVFSDSKGNPKNLNSWTDSSVLNDYITIQNDEIFDYKSVYQNSADDFHPFLDFMLLHFICSFFPNIFSPWFGFILNILFFIIIQIYLYKSIKLITKSEKIGLLGVFFFGFTSAAENMLLFLRMYTPAAAFAIMFIYYVSLYYYHKDDTFIKKSLIAKLFLTTLCGALTLHLFLPFAFVVTSSYCLYYIFKKKIKKGAIFGFTILSATVLSIIIFPATIPHLFGNTGTFGLNVAKYPFIFQAKFFIYYLTSDLFGLYISPFKTMTTTYLIYGIGILLFLTLPLCFVFRNEEWLHKTKRAIINYIIILKKRRKKISFVCFPIIASIVAILLLNAKMVSIFNMGKYSNRFIFIIYPATALLACIIVHYLLDWFIKKQLPNLIISVLIAIFFANASLYMGEHIYYCDYPHTGIGFEDLESDSNCIIMLSTPFLLTSATNLINHTGSFYATTYDTALKQDYSGLDNPQAPLYLLLDVSTFEHGDFSAGGLGITGFKFEVEDIEYDKDEYINYFKNLSIATDFKLVGENYNLYGRKVEIYKLN